MPDRVQQGRFGTDESRILDVAKRIVQRLEQPRKATDLGRTIEQVRNDAYEIQRLVRRQHEYDTPKFVFATNPHAILMDQDGLNDTSYNAGLFVNPDTKYMMMVSCSNDGRIVGCHGMFWGDDKDHDPYSSTRVPCSGCDIVESRFKYSDEDNAAFINRVIDAGYVYLRNEEEIYRRFSTYKLGMWGLTHYLAEYIADKSLEDLQIDNSLK